MRQQHIRVSLVALAAMAALASPAMAGDEGQQPAPPAAVASVPPPPGWKQCPRCQNAQDRKEADAKYKVEGHPFTPRDISGVWGNQGVGATFRTPPPFTPWGQEQFNATIGDKNAAGEPLHTKDTSGEGAGSPVNCDPKGWPRLHTYNYGFEFVVLPDRVLQFFELTHTWRTIWTDGRKLPDPPPQLQWNGWNVGRWDGNTFVVEGVGFDDRSWLSDTMPDGGFPHSDEMRVVERWRRVNYGTLEVQITVTDPKTYTKPWVTPTATIRLSPGAELWEDFCVPSDYNAFNSDVYRPVATGDKK
ncbi:MAG: hypothetical protein HY824_12970 [Acidobacteria bacterium]|nr:hypothetical protein [Acidobacteriota bacterium]